VRAYVVGKRLIHLGGHFLKLVEACLKQEVASHAQVLASNPPASAKTASFYVIRRKPCITRPEAQSTFVTGTGFLNRTRLREWGRKPNWEPMWKSCWGRLN